ncbi:MAG TPA: TonB-dependent receptor [Hanamia sp.]|nr:TonB-dependent receptor [Hanamia sp.]
MKKATLLFSFLITAFFSFAQNRAIRGKITDKSGVPVANVSVTVKGSQQGVSTLPDGTFILDVPQGATTLVVSSVGFGDQEVAIGNSDNLAIVLDQSEQKLETVVVVAYGSQVKRKVTGAVSTVSSTELENRPFTSVDQMLQGKVPGLQSVSPNGQPGGAQTIRIRGVSSITGVNDPLFVVDGVPINSGDFSRNTNTSNALAGINPNDIESVTVLKDASAAAIYGSRAAAGVILITTKKGKSGKTRIRIDAEQGFSDVAFENDISKPLNSSQYLDLSREGLVNAGASPAQIEGILNSLGANSNIDVDWRDLVTRQADFTNLNFSAAGGDQKTTFYTSIGYNKQQSPVIGSDFQRYSGSVNLSHKASERFSIDLSIIGSYSNQNSPTQGGTFRNPVLAASFLRPTQNPYDSNGNVNISRTDFNQVYNPLAIVQYDRGLYRNIKTISTISGRYHILPGLDFTSRFGIDYINIEEEQYYNPFFGDARTTSGNVYNLTTRLTNYVWTNLLDYHYDFLQNKDLGVDVKLGYEAQKSKQYNTTATGTGVPFTTLLTLPVPSTPTAASAERTDFSQVSVFSILQFNYKTKYSLSGSYRNDGSSRFGPNNRYGDYWSVGAAWNIDREGFLTKIPMISLIKLRASYGLTGDNRGVAPYDWRGTYAFGTDYNLQSGSFPSNIGNEDLTWESNRQVDIGLDFGLFDNRLGGTVDWYERNSKNLLFDVPLSLTSGFISRKSNTGTMQNKGWEISLNGTPVRTRDFSWDLSFNISLNKNKITSLPNNNADIIVGNQIRRVGFDVSSIYTVLWAGVDPDNGDPLWYTDATRKTTTNEVPSFQDIIGHAAPKGFGSFGTSLNYKGISLDAQFNYQYGTLVYDSWGFILTSDGSFPSLNKNQKQLRRWQNPGDMTDQPIYIYGNSNNSNAESSRWYYKGDFIRLRDLTLAYQFPKSLLDKIKLDNVSFYVKGTNLWTKTYDKNLSFDPEQGFNGTNDLQVFIQRTISVGTKIGF